MEDDLESDSCLAGFEDSGLRSSNSRRDGDDARNCDFDSEKSDDDDGDVADFGF